MSGVGAAEKCAPERVNEAIFGRFRKNRSAAQRTRGLSSKKGGSRKGLGLANKRHGVTPPT